jgi:CheY-like chemotaxis protein
MSNPLPYLVRMLLFLAVVGAIGWVLHEDLLRVFNNTPILNTVIVGVLVLGIFFVFRQVLILWPEVKWLRRYIHREDGAPPPRADHVNLLAPLATMLGEQERIRLSPTATRAVLDGIATRLDERREIARYTIGLLIFLGLLEAAGYDVNIAADGADAWRVLHEQGADVVVTDIEMPRMDGFELTRQIRGSDRFRDLPVVLITGLDSQRDKERGVAAGANAYLVKSDFDQRNLIDAIGRLV